MSEAQELQTVNHQASAQTALTPMDMIDRALTNNADVETLGKLMDLQERYQSREAKAAYDADMAAMQAELPVIEKTRDGHGWKYADWGDIKRQINPVLTKHGFAVTHRTEARENDIVVTAICSHRDGHREETSLPLPYDTSGSKNAVQARGSSVQYGTRYTGCAIIGVAIGGEDKDGAEADDYDISPWLEQIKNAKLKPDLNKIGDALKAEKDIPPKAIKLIRNAWAARMKALS